jgi:hypothetical protein
VRRRSAPPPPPYKAAKASVYGGGRPFTAGVVLFTNIVLGQLTAPLLKILGIPTGVGARSPGDTDPRDGHVAVPLAPSRTESALSAAACGHSSDTDLDRVRPRLPAPQPRPARRAGEDAARPRGGSNGSASSRF